MGVELFEVHSSNARKRPIKRTLRRAYRVKKATKKTLTRRVASLCCGTRNCGGLDNTAIVRFSLSCDLSAKQAVGSKVDEVCTDAPFIVMPTPNHQWFLNQIVAV